MQTIEIRDPAATLAGLVRDALAKPAVAASLAEAGLALPIGEALGKMPGAPAPEAPPEPCRYEAAARACGYVRKGDGDGIIYHESDFGSWKEAVSWGNEPGQPKVYDTWQECCEGEGIEA